MGDALSVHTELLYALVLPETDRLLAEADNLDAILLAARTIAEEEGIDGFVVLRGGEFDGTATAMAQEQWA